jgi:hypothetical protein
MGLIPKEYEKPVFWAVAILGGLLVLKIAQSGIKGAAAGIVGGVIEGAFDATAGILQGAYNAVPEAVKPSSEKNIIYRAVNGVGSTISGNQSFDLGGWIYDATH